MSVVDGGRIVYGSRWFMIIYLFIFCIGAAPMQPRGAFSNQRNWPTLYNLYIFFVNVYSRCCEFANTYPFRCLLLLIGFRSWRFH